MADPLLQGRYPMRGLYQALAVAAMCLQEQAATRPLIGDVVTALTYLASQTYDPNVAAAQNNKVGSSTPRSRDGQKTNLGNWANGQDETGSRGRQGSQSPHQDSPNFRHKEFIRGVSFGAEVGRGETGSGSGRKFGMNETERQTSQKSSPGYAGRTGDTPRNFNSDVDRERAVAEAKVWGENWRGRRGTNTMGSFDSTNEL